VPIVLIDDTQEQHRLEVGGSAILYTRATGEEVERALRDSRDDSGLPDTVRAGSDLMVRHVVGWEGVQNSRGEDVPYGAGLVAKVIAALPYDVRLRLDAAIVSGWKAASDSGKG